MNGVNKTLPVIDEVLQNSSAIDAGLQKNDEVLSVNKKKIDSFDELRQIVFINGDKEMELEIKRQNEVFVVKITPKFQVHKDIFGDEIRTGMLGITASKIFHKDLNIAESFLQGNIEAYKISISILQAVRDLAVGKRSFSELGGPIKIAKYSGKTTEMGITMTLWFVAMISINLGIMNLLPIPALDGGHLFYYFIELIRRKPMSEKIQQYGFKLGFAMLSALMIFTTLNDLLEIFTK
jgi:regulator of sigma E protease